jgi:hypothetical protein
MSNFDYYNFRIKFVTEKINEEIAFYENCAFYNLHPVKEYLLYLKGRLGMDKLEINTMTHYDNAGNKCEIKKMNLDEHVKDLDIYVFQKPWNKLREFHKIMKVKEFIDGLKFGKKAKANDIIKNKEYLKKEICSGFKNKKFCKNKSEVVYDQKKMIITSISCMDFNKKTGLYEIDWDN